MNRIGCLFAVTVALAVFVGPVATADPFDVSIDYDLGGSCRENGLGSDERHWEDELSRRLAEAREEQNWTRAVSLQEQFVRMSCANAYRWLDLAKFLHRAARDTDTLRIVSGLYDDAPNWFENDLFDNHQPFLKSIQATESYRHSRLSAMRRKNRQAFNQRRSRYRKKLSEVSEDEKPPENYVAEDVCPFECCVYRTWSVHGELDLYGAPRSDTIVARLAKGDTVQGLTGNVYLRPEPVVVLDEIKEKRLGPDRRIKKGDILFVLDDRGEGYSHVWLKGEVLSLSTRGVQRYCPEPGEACWGESLLSDRERRHDWWVKVRTRTGTVGWTNQVGLLGRMDACA